MGSFFLNLCILPLLPFGIKHITHSKYEAIRQTETLVDYVISSQRGPGHKKTGETLDVHLIIESIRTPVRNKHCKDSFLIVMNSL
jgi:hypothetical protein